MNRTYNITSLCILPSSRLSKWNQMRIVRNFGDLKSQACETVEEKNENSTTPDQNTPKLPPRKLIYSKLPRFKGLRLQNIKLVTNQQQLDSAMQVLLEQKYLGFDTETTPSFYRQPISTGPHLIQLSTETTAYLFSTVADWSKSDIGDGSRNSSNASASEFRQKTIKSLKKLLEHRQICKIGFDLQNDQHLLGCSFHIGLNNIIDLAKELAPSKEILGASRATAYFFQEYFEKRKTITVSNWGHQITKLTDSQILYAANDAYIALRIYLAWKEGRTPWNDEELITFVEKTTGFKYVPPLPPPTVVKTDIEYESHSFEVDREIMLQNSDS